ncbi:luciferin 4-monooxygenase-like [Ptychodera flava]|uniref:luciferin 4-monooxygenase-like n=1 Tax=Ptychodera flava TaxID=63121 RepID=UPI00396A4F98
MSVLSVGGVVTTTNPLCSADELIRYLSSSDATWVICAPDCVEKIQEAVAHVTRVKGIFVMGNESVGGCTLFTKLIGDDGSAFPSDLKVNPKQDVAALLFSSGTTGPPKGVMLTHYNVIASVHLQSVPGFLKFESGVDIIPAIIPFFHVAGLVGVLSLGLKQGIRLITLPKFEPETFLRTIQEYKATRILTVPPLVFFLANHPLVDRYDLSSVSDIICGGAPTGPAIIKAVRKRLGQSNIPVREVFGMTELSSLTTIVTTDEEFEIGSVGTLLPNTTAKVIDLETGKTLGVGKEGEICFRGPQVMKGYRNNIEETRKMISEDGWLRTGDIGFYNEKGHFYVVDRLKDLIKYKAYQVAPTELENLILSMPGVKEVAVIGLPHDEAGELPKAFVVPKSDNIKPEDVMKFVEGKVIPQKKLRGGVEFVDEIPKSASGKILRRVLKARK